VVVFAPILQKAISLSGLNFYVQLDKCLPVELDYFCLLLVLGLIREIWRLEEFLQGRRILAGILADCM
jgi:hypothetical protein